MNGFIVSVMRIRAQFSNSKEEIKTLLYYFCSRTLDLTDTCTGLIIENWVSFRTRVVLIANQYVHEFEKKMLN